MLQTLQSICPKMSSQKNNTTGVVFTYFIFQKNDVIVLHIYIILQCTI